MAATIALQLLTMHRTDTIRALFASLDAQTAQGWKLYWRDNGSTDEEYAAMRRIVDELHPRFEIVAVRGEKNIGFSGGHQELYASHDADYVALINDDAILGPRYIEVLAKALDDNAALGAVSGAILRWNFNHERQIIKSSVVDSLGLARNASQKVFDIGAGKPFAAPHAKAFDEVFGVSGCLPMYRRKAIGSQLFDPAYFCYKEDVDAAYRLQKAGWKAGVVYGAVAHHQRTFRPSLLRSGVSYARKFYSYRNHLWNLKKHLTRDEWVANGIFIAPFELAKAAFLLCTNPTILWKTLRKQTP